MHEVFLSRLASHPVFRIDHNFRVFLEYNNDLEVRMKNKKERLEVINVFLFIFLLLFSYANKFSDERIIQFVYIFSFE